MESWNGVDECIDLLLVQSIDSINKLCCSKTIVESMSLIAKLSGSPSSWVSSCWIKSTLTSCCIIFPILTILWLLWKYFFRKWWKSLFFTRFFVVPLLLFNMKLSTSLKCLLPIQRSLIRLLKFYWWTNKKYY